MVGAALKLLLLLQFAIVAAVPCHCVAKKYAAAESHEAVDCCRGGSCRASLDRQETAGAAADLHICPTPTRKSACPGRLLPDLAPPPSAPADDLPTLFAGAPAAIACDDFDHEHDRRSPATFALDARAAPHLGDLSLLRQRCALIV